MEAALNREKSLRKQLTAAQRQLSQHRLEVTSLQNEAKAHSQQLTERLRTTQDRLRAAASAMRALNDRFSLVERLNASLQRCVRDNYPIFAATAASARFLDLQGKAQSLNDAVLDMQETIMHAGSHSTPLPDEDGTPGSARHSAPPPPPIATGASSAVVRNKSTSLAAVLEADAEELGNTAASPLGRPRAGSNATPRGGGDGGGGDGSSGRNERTNAGMGAGAGAASPAGTLSATDVKSFVRQAHRHTVGLITREAQEAAQAAAVRRLHEQFGVGLDAKLTRSPSSVARGSPGSVRGSVVGGGQSPRNTLTPSRRRKTRLTRGSARSSSSPLVPKETTMAEKLRHIFKYYCSFGDRLNVTFLTNPKFFKFVKDARIVGASFRPADVDIVFNQVVRNKVGAQQTGRGSVMPGSRYAERVDIVWRSQPGAHCLVVASGAANG